MTYPVSPVTRVVTVSFGCEVVHHDSDMGRSRSGDGHAEDLLALNV